MLSGLTIRDILIIDHLDLTFGPGLNVLTGETGAGKSILLDCLGFVLGWRGRAELVRQGADKGEVTAVFDIPTGHPVQQVLQEAGLDTEDTLILRRVNMRDGRKSAWINDRRVSAEALRKVSEHLLELHGQHDDKGLLNPKAHLTYLDDYAANDAERAAVAGAWTRLRAATKALAEQEAALAKARAQEDFARHALAELQDWQFEVGEDDTLDKRRRTMQAAQRVRGMLTQAATGLTDGAEGSLLSITRHLEDAAQDLPQVLDSPLAAVGRALAEVAEAQSTLGDVLRDLNYDPSELEQVEERFFALRAMARKHNVAPDALPALQHSYATQLAALEAGDGELETLRAAVGLARTAYDSAAGALTQNRRAAAARLDTAMAQELAPLKMERAAFATTVDAAPEGPRGCDQALFTVQTNPGAPAGPLNKIASGGELSRFLLALKVCLHGAASDATLIFDEIDRGVGGATADAVGRRLATLAGAEQVLVVTHSPQVAARATAHWRVEKTVQGDKTTSAVVALSEGARIDEIARMLSGDSITDAARNAARALLAG